jgi:protein-disulfide isomerase
MLFSVTMEREAGAIAADYLSEEISRVMKKICILGSAMLLLSAGVCRAQDTKVSPAQAEAQAPSTSAATKPIEAFPPVNLKNFTAQTPSRDTVEAFLHTMWGYDDNRIWSVAAIQQTPAAGVSRVVVFVKDKTSPDKGNTTVFFVTPDGKHAIADNVIPFGAKPFAENRQMMIDKANGAAKGAAGKELLLVEFADLQCPHCKEFQDSMEKLAVDFPTARIVFMHFPIGDLHPWAMHAAEDAECIRKEKGDTAAFTYMNAVFEWQGALTAESGEQTLANAVTKAGADPAKVKTCAALPATRAAVDEQKRVGIDLGVDQTPTLVVNGRVLPVGGVNYELLKRIIVYQAAQDGITVKVQPSLNTLK